jgi:large-conductance mechanosensitive channel
MKHLDEFKAVISGEKVMGLAVALVIGAALGVL